MTSQRASFTESDIAGSRSSVSVIIPAFNCARYIGGALESVAAQNYGDLEIIVVDDRSTDDIHEVIVESGIPCRYICNEGARGPAGARNFGIEQSRATYLAFLDADDQWLPYKLERQIQELDADHGLLAISGQMIPWGSKLPATTDKRATSELVVQKFNFADLVVSNRLATPTVVCRRDAVKMAGGFDESMRISEDYDLWLRLSRVGPVGRLEIPMAIFRQRPDGTSAGNRDLTYLRDLEFAQSLTNQYKAVPQIRRLVRKGIAARALERAIELCDIEHRYRDAFFETVKSIWNWPWADPLCASRPFTRCRRVRRIVLNAMWHREAIDA